MNLEQGDFFPEENLDEVRDKTRILRRKYLKLPLYNLTLFRSKS